MLDKIRFTVLLDRPFYQPGQTIQGHVVCEPHHPLEIDCVEGRLHGEIQYFQQLPPNHNRNGSPLPPSKTRVLIDEKAQLWKYQTVSEMLGLDVFYDENQNRHFSSESASASSSSLFTTAATFPIQIELPHFAPPSFYCPGSPVSIRFTLEIQLYNQGFKIASHEENLVVLNYESIKRQVTPKPVNFQKTFNFPKERSISLEMLLPTDVFTTTARLENCITICNRWKQSLKYVHLNIVRRISALNQNNEVIDTVKIDTTGVGLPSKTKIAVGETYSFRPTFNVPALPPNIHVNGLFKTEYSLKVTIGRAHNFVLASYEVPITIVTMDQSSRRSMQKEDILVDISASNNTLNNLPVDLLA
ncbi:Protein ttm-2 [Caenorhabditis elegans]|uniref:Protein ttm-2 n=1 Tax=Caenorhabditis elegans TaxID=6239 RepID=TTM2_CAEEL|nr:Protein ttm-2 [Caenorhabditis elegans]Q19829.1 RecName: Full=Protein ttm-2; AltName: Full=Toxin-regulated target of MAPK 2 [Caenorhabditis elegans]CCD65847.1 Protein ttm-2 [Caenorhabditis elegans]|eukprot:NP_494855.1 Toxin-regulated Targets of MAPK [Caenorhabditis elegans]